MIRAAAGIGTTIALAVLACASAAAAQYADETAFLRAIAQPVTDGYEHPGYAQPDNLKETMTDAWMSAVRGETRYRATGFADRNIVERQSGEAVYCAGCNGSFELSFTSTSISDASGVFGVGMRIVANQSSYPYVAYVRYGDLTAENVTLPVVDAPAGAPAFWGITSPSGILSIHFGGFAGVAVTVGGFAIDDLTIGAQPPPDADADGIPDADDNCTTVPNGPWIPDAGGKSQLDADDDGYGNACDGDLDQSGFVTTVDFNLLRSVFNQHANAGALAAAADLNGSGTVTTADFNLLRNMLNHPPGPSGVAGGGP